MLNAKKNFQWNIHQWFTLIAVSIASFQEPLATTMTVVALPDIEQATNANFTELQWIINAYVLMFAAFVLTAGAFMDLLGRRLVFVIGMSLFALGFLSCGLATNPLWLIISRGVLGLGAALSLGLPLLVYEFDGRDRATAFGIWGVAVCIGSAFGPLIGGIINDVLSWRWIFLTNVPVCLVVIILTLTQVRESSDPDSKQVDWMGLLSFTGMFFLLMFALIEGNEQGWKSPTIVGAFAGSIVLLISFLVVERHQARPMFDLNLFRLPTFIGASTIAVVIAGTFFTLIVYLPLYFQSVLGYSATQAGLALIPMAVPLLVMGPISGRLANLLPSRIFLSIGLAIIAVGVARMLTISANSGLSALLGGMVLAGIGAGLINGELSNVAVSVAPSERSGMASGINHTMRQLGFGIAIAGLGAIFSYQVRNSILTAVTDSATVTSEQVSELVEIAISGDIESAVSSFPIEIQSVFTQISTMSFVVGMRSIFIVIMIVALSGAALTYMLVKGKDILANSSKN